MRDTGPNSIKINLPPTRDELELRRLFTGLGAAIAAVVILAIVATCHGCATTPSTTITGPATELHRDVQESGPSTETVITVGVPQK